jgi:hypothetical protein
MGFLLTYPIQWAIMRWNAPNYARHVLQALVVHANDSGVAWPSQRALKDETGWSVASVKRGLAIIEADPACPIVLKREHRQVDGKLAPDSNRYLLSVRPMVPENLGSEGTMVQTDQGVGSVGTEGRFSGNPTSVQGELQTSTGKDEREGLQGRMGEGAADAGPAHTDGEFSLKVQEPEAPNQKAPKRKRARLAALETPYPEGFAPNEANYNCGERLGFNHAQVDELVEAMRDAYTSKPRTYADWHAAFNTYMRNKVDWAKPRTASGSGRNPYMNIQPGEDNPNWGKEVNR